MPVGSPSSVNTTKEWHVQQVLNTSHWRALSHKEVIINWYCWPSTRCP